ncbi:MAG: dephospho- kinase [Lasallia pustulata]|uniref:Dephospho-kinase n=1 Tax=Lasallia pustulata TaxID=136370 RepID=A0A5M8PI16_9LECA|nr:MAG: dephospho- kinase [Lasallia pustulata]
MLLIGLTGSIATGKSTVSALLHQPPHSLPIIDADLLARKVVAPGTPAYARIIAHFAPSTPDLLLPASASLPAHGIDGKGRPLNRAALGRLVFGEGEERRRERAVLNGIVHPAVRWAMAREVLGYWARGWWAVVLDIPLLFESGLDVWCGVVIVVAVRDPEVQMRRLRERDRGLSGEEARGRVESQWDVRDKARRAGERGRGRGVVVWNDGGREELEREVKRVMEGVRTGSPWWWGWLLWVVPVLGAVGVWGLVRNWWARRRWEEGKKREKAKL